MSDWVTSIATIVLVCVTAYYAKLTRDIAKSSGDAADASSEAAAQAKRSVSAALAGTEVDLAIVPAYRFTGRDDPTWPPEDPGFNFGVHLLNRGAHLYVHGVNLNSLYRAEILDVGERRGIPTVVSELMLSDKEHHQYRLHQQDVVDLWSPSIWLPRKFLAGVVVDVAYSFDGVEVFERRVPWWGAEDRDFESYSYDPIVRDEAAVSNADGWSLITPDHELREGIRWKQRRLDDLIQRVSEDESPHGSEA